MQAPCQCLAFQSHNFSNTPEDNQAIRYILRQVTVREIWHEFAVVSHLDWVFEALVGSIGLYGCVEVGLV